MKIIFLVFILFTSLAQATYEVPALRGPVMDEAQVLKSSTYHELDSLLREMNQRGKVQLQILIVKSLAGEPIESASIRIVDKWKLGDAKKDNGVLFLISMQDRKLRIEVGQGLEGAIPDAIANRIIADRVVPLFKSGRISEGVEVGAYSIVQLADKEFADEKGVPNSFGKKWNGDTVVFIFVMLLVLIMIIFRRIAGGAYYYSGYGRSSGGWSSGGSGWGGSSSGGGWSGGGGGFSGGGSSGSW